MEQEGIEVDDIHRRENIKVWILTIINLTNKNIKLNVCVTTFMNIITAEYIYIHIYI